MMRLDSRFNSLPLCLALLIAPGILPAQVPSTQEPQSGTKEQRKNDEVVIDWLKENAIPIKGVEAGNGFADLQPLKRILADARVVGLGEATHGTREFFQFKHRMVEFLVREMNFNVFAIEANYAGCLKVNDYVTGGKASRVDALQNLGFPGWQTEEVAALVDWLRAYNQTIPSERKVKFYGFDMQDMGGSDVVLGYLKRADPEKTQEVLETLTKVGAAAQAAIGGSKENLKGLLPEIDKLIRYFVLQEGNFTYKTSLAEYEMNLHRLRLLFQAADYFSQELNDTRDRYMAENIVYMLNRERPGTRIAVWAHNGHISTGGIFDGKAMGAYLRQRLANEYYAFGFTFNDGSFQAMANRPTGDTPYVEYTAGPAPEKSVDWYFAQTRIGNYLVDFRHSSKDEVVQQWLNTSRGMRSVGGYGVPPNIKDLWAAGKNIYPSNLSKEYDGMIFIERTTRARPLSR
jgi:erythromycin esterase